MDSDAIKKREFFSLNSITTTSCMIANDTGEYSLMQYFVL